MRFARRLLASALVYALAVQPTLAQVVSSARIQNGSAVGGQAGAVGSGYGGLKAPKALSLGSFDLKSASLPGMAAAPGVIPSVTPAGSDFSPASPAALSIPAGTSPRLSKPLGTVTVFESGPIAPVSKKFSFAERVGSVALEVGKAAKGFDSKDHGDVRTAAGRQFDALIGAKSLEGSGLQTPTSGMGVETGGMGSGLKAASDEKKPDASGVPAPKQGWTTVFKEPERNKGFWRYLLGYVTFLFGFQMYIVGLPYLVSALTKNTLSENNDLRLENAEALRALVRQNRSLARIAHWTAQAVSYLAVPLFSRASQDGPKKWLVRSFFIRAGVLAFIPALFFASGLFTMQTAFWVFFGLIAAQSFFQGLSVTMEGAATTRIFGAKGVTAEERRKANSILTIAAAAISIIAPALAGQVSQIKDLFGKTGAGGAVIYGIYALAVGVAGLIYATVRIFGGKAKEAEGDAGKSGTGEAGKTGRLGLKGGLKEIWASLKEGATLIFKNRFLRTMLAMSLIGSLFSDPLIFNVLPEFASNIIKSSAGLGGLLQMPVIGWFLTGLTSTPMGYFALMMAIASVGSIVASLMVKPLTKLFKRFGFKTEESLSIPFYVLAALEVPLFWAMIYTPTMMGVLAFYGLQALMVGFSGIAISGLRQKELGKLSGKQINRVLAANSFLSILAAIASTFIYGFVLTEIPLAAALLIAAVATTVLGVVRLAAPWLMFSKDQRKGAVPEVRRSKPEHPFDEEPALRHDDEASDKSQPHGLHAVSL